MARVCELSGKGPLSGNKRSHSLRSTRRKWNVNLQKKTVIVNPAQAGRPDSHPRSP